MEGSGAAAQGHCGQMTTGSVFPSCLNRLSSCLPLLLEAVPDAGPPLLRESQWTLQLTLELYVCLNISLITFESCSKSNV